jgi:hypothetical protein
MIMHELAKFKFNLFTTAAAVDLCSLLNYNFHKLFGKDSSLRCLRKCLTKHAGKQDFVS